MANFQSIKDLVLFGLAIYAAVLSTFNLIQSINRDRRSIKVTMETLMPTYGASIGPPYAQLLAINAGHRPVTITVLTFQLRDKKRLFPLQRDILPGYADSDLPAKLDEGESARHIMSYEQVAEALLSHGMTGVNELLPICQDNLGRIYKGASLRVDPREWLQMARS